MNLNQLLGEFKINQILDKMLLMAFGLMSLLIIAPWLFLLVENNFFSNSDLFDEHITQIEDDLSNLKINIEKHKNGNLKGQTYYFTFSGEINIVHQKIENSTILHLNFYYDIARAPIYLKCAFGSDLNITVRSLQILQYSILQDNNVITIIFS